MARSWRSQRRVVKAIAAFTLVILLIDLNRDGERCGQDCYGTHRTYEPGHAWTNYPGSWQWDAQNGIVALAFIAGVAGFVYMLADRRQRAMALAGASLALNVAWLIWVALSPPIG